MVFVHGHEGSAQQWQSQAKRFSSNGYPDRLLHAFEYNTRVPTDDHAIAELEEFVDGVRSRTGAPRIDVIAHSRGTRVLHRYLSVPERAAEVRKYVNLDGASSAEQPGGVPTLAIWGSAQPNGSIGGAVNVHTTDQGHTETATSARSFAHIHAFLRGRAPATEKVLPEPPGRVEIAGRAVHFPLNSGLAGRLEVWRLDPATGARADRRPRHVVRTGTDGAFGPLDVNGRHTYELVLVRPGERVNHFYPEPFERSDRFVRLLVSAPGGVADRADACPGHTSVTVVRNREWWADTAAPDADRLELNGVQVLNPAVSPAFRQILAVFAFDRDCDGASHTEAPLPPFDRIPFLTATDLHLPASPAADGTITVTQTMRGTGGETRTLAVRNWPSDSDTVSVLFKDYADTAFGRTHGPRTR
ncbi:hypothetical protein [Streptomyces xinghaiensis]|uniref:hypothetical protein n=1 Tax=Streptomyces xinghaiensis TaxID=1038928 RepID=UPI0002E541BD|nr:hypothetical protein [Streptomyces xinghaiensis]MZE80457.1 alpha/beta hydrolase [Streptomyces sp. SID5475]